MFFAMTKKPNLIFDAGGVLVFPDFDLLAEFANQVGIETSAKEIAAQHAQLLQDFDEQVARHHQFPAIHYFLDLFKRVTPSIEKAQAALELTSEAEKEKHLWATTQPWVNEALRKLKGRGYKMAVISNSEGIVEKILQDLGLRENFEIVIDSFVVGVEKPDSRIFEIALERLGWDRSETIYIGDIFYVDIWGANQAGLGAIHLDKMGLYAGWDGVHIPSIKELPDLLANANGKIQDLNLFPTLDFEIN
jgi:putative hydrolase of the HAD superfamily